MNVGPSNGTVDIYFPETGQWDYTVPDINPSRTFGGKTSYDNRAYYAGGMKDTGSPTDVISILYYLSAGFVSDVTEICQYDVVSYSDMSSGDITSWNWTFEGGDPATSTEQNPMVTYNETGSFDVTQEVSDGTNTDILFLENYITVEMTPPVMLSPFDDVIISEPAFELTGGSPAGGDYSGPGVTDNWFYPGTAGLGEHTITYTYTATNGCENSADETITVVEETGINEHGNDVIQIHPNPAYDQFNINVTLNGKISIEIYTLVGVKVYELETYVDGTFQKSIDVSGMESGVYFVSVRTSNERYIEKLSLLK